MKKNTVKYSFDKVKTLKQKCIDLHRAIDLYARGQLDADYETMLLPALYSLNNDMQNFTLNDEEGYQTALKNWQNSKPAYADPV